MAGRPPDQSIRPSLLDLFLVSRFWGPVQEAQRLAARFEFHYTPKHGSWLNMAEIELSALSRMCLDRRLPDKDALTRAVAAWESERNAKSVTVEWRFTTDDARIKLKKLYPTISV